MGEAYVWLTAMGLTVGLAMIVALLGLVVIQGCGAFWPKRVVQLTVREDSSYALHGSNVFGGEITKRQRKVDHLLRTESGLASPAEEWQLFVANKDVYGLTFKFVDVEDMVRVDQPAGVLRLERLEYGPAIGFPVRIESKDRPPIPAEGAGFRETLRRLVEEAARLRESIRRIEKVEIGAISRELERLRLREATIARATVEGPDASGELEAVRSRQALLREPYDRLAAEARELRARQQDNLLVYRLLSGQERRLPFGQIIDFYAPNELDTVDRMGLFLRKAWSFVIEEPREANTDGGIFPAIFGTFVMTLLMSVVVMPFGVVAAIYLREYATQGPLVRAVRIAVNNLAGVPSIVFGVFGLGFFVYLTGASIDQLFFRERLPTPTFGTGGILWASLTLALMTVPVVIVASEEALAAVSRGAREGSLACGASKWQTIQRIVLPAAAPGILTGLILAMARGAGEVAPLMLVGVVKLAPDLPLSLNYPFLHLDQKFMHLGFHIYDLGFQSPDSEAARPMVFATTLFLIALVILLNLSAIVIRERLRRRTATMAF